MNKPVLLVVYTVTVFSLGAAAHALFAKPNVDTITLSSNAKTASKSEVLTQQGAEQSINSSAVNGSASQAAQCETAQAELLALSEQLEEEKAAESQEQIKQAKAKALRDKLFARADSALDEQRLLDKIGALSAEIAAAIGLSSEEFQALNEILLDKERADQQARDDLRALLGNPDNKLSSSDKSALRMQQQQKQQANLAQYESQVVSALSAESVQKYRDYEKQKVQAHYDNSNARKLREVGVFIDDLEEYKKQEIADYFASQKLDLNAVKLGTYQGRFGRMIYNRPFSGRDFKEFLKQSLTESQYNQYIANQELVRLSLK